jgi:signal transduction histidine kinase
LLTQIEESHRDKFEENNIGLNSTLAEQPISIIGDSIGLTQVFGNLLDNAAKHTDKGGMVNLTGLRQANEAVVSIRDTGIGIPPD